MRVISLFWLRPCPLYTPPVAPTDWVIRWIIQTAMAFGSWTLLWKVLWTLSLRGRRSRNKVSVGEPAEGSFACFGAWILIEHISKKSLCTMCVCVCRLCGWWCGSFSKICTAAETTRLWHFFWQTMNQWWMFWLIKRWRAQRTVVIIVNCRIPWTNWILI